MTNKQAYANMLLMSPENIPGGESKSIHPEVIEDIEATIPATEQSKQALVEAIDDQLAGKSTREFKGEVSKGRDMRDPDGNPLSVWRYLDGRENMATVTHTVWIDGRPDGANSRTNYHIKRIPDGLSVEKFYHEESAAERKKQFGDLSGDPAKAIEAIEGKIAELSQMVAAQQDERELGLTFVSERDVKNITQLIKSATPSSM